jgi:hypothetical protein
VTFRNEAIAPAFGFGRASTQLSIPSRHAFQPLETERTRLFLPAWSALR